jgi:hypothetical protein
VVEEHGEQGRSGGVGERMVGHQRVTGQEDAALDRVGLQVTPPSLTSVLFIVTIGAARGSGSDSPGSVAAHRRAPGVPARAPPDTPAR